ncbi:hypothetical protein BU15DRAFT_66693 [Melanogaster broomeanus]|nr:hypothetical protein BU15DRAFT_66693 [Melanogaster broomeanus]
MSVLIVALSQGTAAIADVIVFVRTCYSLCRARYPDIVLPHNIADKTAVLLVNLPVFTVISVYVKAVLGLLNAHEVRHGKGLNEGQSFSTERKPTAAAGLPSGILVDHVDTSTTQRNITFLSRHPDIENSGSEMESRKTYQDANGKGSRQSESIICAEASSARALSIGHRASCCGPNVDLFPSERQTKASELGDPHTPLAWLARGIR